MTHPGHIWDKFADSYSKRPVSDQKSYETKLRTTKDYLKPDMEVLEFGCGTGTTAIFHAPYVKHIHAVDISGKMLEIAKAKTSSAGVTNITYEQSSIEDLVVPEGHYDVVMGHSILHLLEDKDGAVAKVYGMLKPGGAFITSTICITGWMSLLKLVIPVGRLLGLLPLVKFFNKRELEETITNAGFVIDHRWQPKKGMTLFLIAMKPG